MLHYEYLILTTANLLGLDRVFKLSPAKSINMEPIKSSISRYIYS